MINKYIGETEKNLAEVFDAAAHGAAILFFDEADAVFGKRSEVKDAHDRYANIEINYVGQRVEAFDGVVILATNLRQNIDEAFLRRLDAFVEIRVPWGLPRSRPFSPPTPTGVYVEESKFGPGPITGAVTRAAGLLTGRRQFEQLYGDYHHRLTSRACPRRLAVSSKSGGNAA